ncbi:retrovirus-related pol polyprotein from transposon TNT 1-94 [Tanacetum coccineum]
MEVPMYLLKTTLEKIRGHALRAIYRTEKGHFQNRCSKLVASRDKEVNMKARDYDDALVCCVENTVEDRIMDYGTSFHATYCKEELERFKLRSEESFLHNVSEDKETAEVGANCSRSCGRYNANLQVKYLKFDNGGEYSSWSIKFCVENGIVMLKMVPKTPLQFGIAKRLSQTFRAESTGLRVEASKMLWADSVSTTYLIYRIPYVSMWVKDVCEEAMKCTFIGNFLDKIQYSFQNTKSHHVIRSRDITFIDSIHGARSVTDSSSLTKLIQKSQMVLVDIPDDLVENDSIVVEHGLSSEITQSPGRSSDKSEGSEDSGSFEDSENQMNNTLKTEHPPRREALTLHRYKYPPESPGLRDGSTIRIPESDYLQEKRHHKACRCSKLKKSRIAAKGTRLDWWLRFPIETREPSYVGALNDTSTHHKREGFQLAAQEENLKCILKEILYGLIQAPRLRYLKFDSFMQNDKLLKGDDMLVVGSDMAEFNKPKWKWSLSFVEDLGRKCYAEMLTSRLVAIPLFKGKVVRSFTELTCDGERAVKLLASKWEIVEL